MKKYYLFLIIALLTAVSVSAGKPHKKKVKGEYTYRCTSADSQDEAKRKAIEGAKKEALVNAFGVLVDGKTYYEVVDNNGDANSDFMTVMSSNVRGEWIEITKEKAVIVVDKISGTFLAKAEVEGVAREIEAAKPLISATVLNHCDDSPDKECLDFKNEESIFLHFKSPVKGYLLVYLLDENDEVSRLLPYSESGDSNVRIEAQKDYTFFSIEKAPGELSSFTRELVLFTNKHKVLNHLYVIFSENPIHVAPDQKQTGTDGENRELPRYLEAKEFFEYLGDMRTRDVSVQVLEKDIVLNK